MSRILVCGLCPLPFENTPRNYGPGIRTWQFAKGLADAGHEVHLLAMMIDNSYDSPPPATEVRDTVQIERVDYATFMDPTFVGTKISELNPDALVGATIYGSYALAQTEPSTPFWADQFGHVMAEAQAKAALEQDNWPIAHFWPMAELVGRWCDRISTVSERQRYATIGELGVLGRLNAESSGYEFTASIPCAVAPERVADNQSGSNGAIRGSVVPEDAFVVLWSGGYNVWSDVDTIFFGVDAAMAADEHIHFVSTGAGIDGHDLDTYSRFQKLVESSRHKDRFHLMGWVLGDIVPKIVAESNIGILAERPIYEGLLGSKNRIIEWMAGDLAVAYNRHGDLGDILAQKNLAYTFDVGDGDALAAILIAAAQDPNDISTMVERARHFALTEFSFDTTTMPLQEWCQNPQRAPDRTAGQAVVSPIARRSLKQDLSAVAGHTKIGRSEVARRIWQRVQRVRQQRENQS